MKSKKLLSFILSVLLVSSMLFAACAPAKEQTNADVPAKDDSVEANAGDSNDAELPTEEKYEFPGKNYGGYKIRIITPDQWWAMSTLTAEEENGDPLNDAIFRRNRLVEDNLGVEIVQTCVSGPDGKARKSIQSNTDEYDVVFTDSAQAGNLASQGMYLNLYDVPGLNLEKSYWNQRANQSAELLGKLYFTTSDANIITNDAIWVLYFNKKIQQDLGIGDPYALVREGKWTMEAFYNMAKESAKDLDGDGKWSAADLWGISTHGLGFLAFLECQEERLIKLNAEGEPYLIDPSERFISAFIKAHELMNKENGLWLHGEGSFIGKTAELDHQTKTFMANLSLFCAEVLGHARVFREMTADFGVLPHPKYDEKQENYYTFMIDTVPAFGIPITVGDSERSGVFMDAFTAISVEVIMPAYYKISLEGKFTRDEDSIEMLDIIRDGRIFDLAVLYNWGGFYSAAITYGTGKEGTNPMSVFDKNRGKVEVAIKKTLDAYNSWD